MAGPDNSSEETAADQLIIEGNLLLVPTERLRLSLRASQRAVDAAQKKIHALTGEIAQLARLPSAREQIVERVQQIRKHLVGLQAQLRQANSECQKRYEELTARQRHLSPLYTSNFMSHPDFDEWSKSRLNRYLVDYFARAGRIATMEALIKQKGLHLLCDADLRIELQGIESSLRDGQLEKALSWCEKNRHSLKKASSTLEFHLRMQQFLEYIKEGTPEARRKAIAYSQRYIGQDPAARDVLPLLGSILIFSTTEHNERYEPLYDPKRYTSLASLFITTAHELFGLPKHPPLVVALSVGISAIKSPECEDAEKKLMAGLATSASPESSANRTCPICSSEIAGLASGLPYAHHTRSHLDIDLVVLPNGSVYSEDSLERANAVMGYLDDDKLRDPHGQGEIFDRSEIRKVFIS